MNILGFLWSSERSGSNLLTQMINAHPNVCGPAPSHMIRLFAQNLNHYWDLKNERNWAYLLEDVNEYFKYLLGEWKSTPNFLELSQVKPAKRRLKTVIEYAYNLETKNQGKNSIFIKENKVYQFLPYLMSEFPSSKYVYLVRDPRDTVLSFKKAINIPVGLVSAVDLWRRDQKYFAQCFGYLKEAGHVKLVKYEDLTTNPKDSLVGICEHLGISFYDEMLHFQKHQETKKNSGKWPEWQNLSKPLLSQNFGKYKKGLEPAEIKYIESECRDLMAYFSYVPDYEKNVSKSVSKDVFLDSDEKLIQEKKKKKDELDHDNVRKNRINVIHQVLNRRLN